MGHSGNGWPILNEKQLIAIKIDMNTCSLDVKCVLVTIHVFFFRSIMCPSMGLI